MMHSKLPPDFNVDQYRQLNPDLASLSIYECKEHYITHGEEERRLYKIDLPSDFNEEVYQLLHEDLTDLSSLECKLHYANCGKKEGRLYKIDLPFDFVPEYYRQLNKDLASLNDTELCKHYFLNGINEGRIYRITLPPHFTPDIYRGLNGDLSHMNAMELKIHYCTKGRKENRRYDLDIPYNFDIEVYRTMHPDIQNLNDYEILMHYLTVGKKENRIINFDWSKYLLEYPDLKNFLKNKREAIQHYSFHGRNENRKYFSIMYLRYDVLNSANLPCFSPVYVKRDAKMHIMNNMGWDAVLPPSLKENDILFFGENGSLHDIGYKLYPHCDAIFEYASPLPLATNFFTAPFDENNVPIAQNSMRYKHYMALREFRTHLISLDASIEKHDDLLLTLFYKYAKLTVLGIPFFYEMTQIKKEQTLKNFFIRHLKLNGQGHGQGHVHPTLPNMGDPLYKKVDNIQYIKKHDNYFEESKVDIRYYNDSVFILTLKSPSFNNIEYITLINSIHKIKLVLPIENKRGEKRVTFFIKMDELKIMEAKLGAIS